jgi:hypothetical protein
MIPLKLYGVLLVHNTRRNTDKNEASRFLIGSSGKTLVPLAPGTAPPPY